MKHLLLCTAIVLAICLDAEARFEKYKWAIENRGEAQTIELDHITTYKVQARAGEDLDIPKNLPTTAKKVIVAVLDTGFDFNHPDLQGQFVRKESECKALDKFLACVKEKERKVCEKEWMTGNNPEVDQDKNGYPMDCHGWSILGSANAAGILGRPDFSDDQGHGTHVAGIIRSVSKNSILLPVQVLGKKPTEPLKPMSIDSVDITPGEKGKEKFKKTLGDLVARGMNYAINSGAEVINFSMGWPASHDSDYLRSVIAEAQRRGIIIVAAAGNDSTRALLRPCAYPGVICVASHGPDGSLSHFSNYGSGVDIAAPGTNILSTYPTDMRPIRFREALGYEYLHGTSQAAPQVAGVVAEMIAQGIPKDEIYPRLILGSRKLKSKLPLLEGAAHDLKEDTASEKAKLEPKFVLSGQIDMQAAMTTTLNPLILPTEKDKKEITWDRKSSVLKVSYSFKNFTTTIPSSELQVSASYFNADPNVVRPQISGLRWSSNKALWEKNEVRDLEITFVINDTTNLDQSRIVSDLDVALEFKTKKFNYRIVKEAEVTVPIGAESQIAGFETLPILSAPQQRVSWIAIDENIDGMPETDYMAVAEEDQKYSFYLMKQRNGKYDLQGSLTKRMGEDLELARIQVLARLPGVGPSNQPLYAIGILIDRSENQKTSSLELLIVDSQLKVQRQYSLSSEKVQLPTRIYWQRCGGELCPSWFGLGYDPARKRGLRDRWENPDNREKPKSRLYYMSTDGKLNAIEKMDGYEVIDLLNPSIEQKMMGRLPLLLAQNQGPTQKPSYLYDFKLADLENGVPKEASASRNLQGIQRNLLDTRVDEVLSLDQGSRNFQGTFWFANGPDRTQRITMLNQFGPSVELLEQILPAARGTVDSTLRVRAAFAGRDHSGAFSFSNSEVQFHDLKSGQLIAKSLERYTFFPDALFTAAQFPVVIADSQNSRELIPALFTTEESGLNRGVKIKAALRNQNGELTEIASPAKLRFKTSIGCKPLSTPVTNLDGVPAFDYFCGNKIIRAPLIY